MKNEPRDLYADLGIARGASAKEIKRAYRDLAKIHHPDRNPGDADAEARFKRISEAYETLSDPDARTRYDETGEYGGQAGRGEDARFQETLSLALQDVITKLGKLGGDLAMNNLVIHMRAEIGNQNTANRKELMGMEMGLEQLRKAVGRFTVDGEDAGENKLEAAVRAMIRLNVEGCETLESQYQMNLQVLDYISKAKYRTDGPASGPATPVKPMHRVLVLPPSKAFQEFLER